MSLLMMMTTILPKSEINSHDMQTSLSSVLIWRECSVPLKQPEKKVYSSSSSRCYNFKSTNRTEQAINSFCFQVFNQWIYQMLPRARTASIGLEYALTGLNAQSIHLYC